MSDPHTLFKKAYKEICGLFKIEPDLDTISIYSTLSEVPGSIREKLEKLGYADGDQFYYDNYRIAVVNSEAGAPAEAAHAALFDVSSFYGFEPSLYVHEFFDFMAQYHYRVIPAEIERRGRAAAFYMGFELYRHLVDDGVDEDLAEEIISSASKPVQLSYDELAELTYNVALMINHYTSLPVAMYLISHGYTLEDVAGAILSAGRKQKEVTLGKMLDELLRGL